MAGLRITVTTHQNPEIVMSRTHFLLTVPILAALAFAGAALAHPKLLATTPSANASVVKPGKIELKFSEALIGQMTGAEVVMTGMPGMANHAPMKITGFTAAIGQDRKTLTLLMRRALSAGTYRVTWHAVSTDTHRVQGTFNFTVK